MPEPEYPRTRDEEYWQAILDEIRALKRDLQRLAPKPEKRQSETVELKEPAKPKEAPKKRKR